MSEFQKVISDEQFGKMVARNSEKSTTRLQIAQKRLLIYNVNSLRLVTATIFFNIAQIRAFYTYNKIYTFPKSPNFHSTDRRATKLFERTESSRGKAAIGQIKDQISSFEVFAKTGRQNVLKL